MSQTNRAEPQKKPIGALIGGLIVFLLISGAAVAWYYRVANRLTVNKAPNWSEELAKMEDEGVPDFDLLTVDGKPFKLSENLKTITIVNFWASWCAPCVEEFPSMMKLVEEMKGEVKVVAVSADSDEDDLKNFLKAFGLPKENFDVVWDKESSVRKTYGVEKVPESFIVNKKLRLLKKVLGIDNWSDANAIGFFRDLVTQQSKK